LVRIRILSVQYLIATHHPKSLFCQRAAGRYGEPETALRAGASYLLDLLVLFHQGKSTRKNITANKPSNHPLSHFAILSPYTRPHNHQQQNPKK